jgi:hypothetical protein
MSSSSILATGGHTLASLGRKSPCIFHHVLNPFSGELIIWLQVGPSRKKWCACRNGRRGGVQQSTENMGQMGRSQHRPNQNQGLLQKYLTWTQKVHFLQHNQHYALQPT